MIELSSPWFLSMLSTLSEIRGLHYEEVKFDIVMIGNTLHMFTILGVAQKSSDDVATTPLTTPT